MQKGFSSLFLIIILSFMMLVFSAALFIFVASKLRPNDLSSQYITDILLSGFKIPIDFVTAVWEKIKDPLPGFTWWKFY